MKLTLPALLLANAVNHASAVDLAGFTLTSDVAEHSEIDLDLRDLTASLTSGNTAEALAGYNDGYGNSVHGSGSVRNLKGFTSTAKKTGEWDYSLQVGAGYATTWADDYTVAQISDTALTPATVTYATKWNNVKTYVLHELIDAVNDYEAGNTSNNEDAVKAWDEGWAFFAGSAQTTAGATGYSLFQDIKTVSTGFVHQYGQPINDKILAKYIAGQTILAATPDAAKIAELTKIVEDIHALTNAAAIMHLYSNTAVTTPTDENKANAKVFAKVLYPELAACSKGDAAVLLSNVITADSDSFLTEGFAAGVLAPFVNNMQCLKILCDTIGANSGLDIPITACTTNPLPPAVTSLDIAGYITGSDVRQHNAVDRDILRIGNFIKGGDFVNAYKVYSEGWNSAKTSSMRNLRGFSFGAESKLARVVPSFAQYKSYWGDNAEFADSNIASMLTGSLATSIESDTAKKEMILKGIVSESIYMYTLREFYDAIDDCEAGTIAENDAGVHAWDEGVAFYTGSQVTDAGHWSNGHSLYTLANKRCSNFGTCDDDHAHGNSNVNTELFELFETGRNALLANSQNCAGALDILGKVESKMLVPNVQGMLRYAWKNSKEGAGDKERAEGWAFARNVLPKMAACEAVSAEQLATVRVGMEYEETNRGADFVYDYEKIYRAAEAAYGCLGITCVDVGDLTVGGGGCTGDACPVGTTCQYVAPDNGGGEVDGGGGGAAPTIDDDGNLEMGVGVAILGAAVIVLAGGMMGYSWGQKQAKTKFTKLLSVGNNQLGGDL